MKVAIVDYGMGNLRSVEKAFKRLGIDAAITNDIDYIGSADKLVLPGVGNFKTGMSHLSELKLIDVLNQKVLNDKTPILGICLGMQLFTNHSEEGNANGLGWIDAHTVKFQFEKSQKEKVPHIGWNSMEAVNDCPLFPGTNTAASYYFVHSYFVICNSQENLVGTTHYGVTFASSIQKENIVGVQFHPEKSHDDGMLLIKNFIEKY